MKMFNKQILEAINRGINLALDDVEDQNSDIQVLSYGKIKSDSIAKEYVDLMNIVVDLGLPSGTLWCKYNLGVDSNVIENYKNPNVLKYKLYLSLINYSELDNYMKFLKNYYGDYYAWGDIKTQKIYDWDNYKWCKEGPAYEIITKYILDSTFSNNVDNLSELLPEDDAAYLNMHCHNFKFHIPTKELCEELLKYTIRKWDTEYNGIYKLNGITFTSKINGVKIFFPYGSQLKSNTLPNDMGAIWTSSLSKNDDASAVQLVFNAGNCFLNNCIRYTGCNIRPVINLDKQ